MAWGGDKTRWAAGLYNPLARKIRDFFLRHNNWVRFRNRGPQFINFLAGCERGAAAFLASFGPFWLRVDVRVRLRAWVHARTLIPPGSAS